MQDAQDKNSRQDLTHDVEHDVQQRVVHEVDIKVIAVKYEQYQQDCPGSKAGRADDCDQTNFLQLLMSPT